MEQGNAFVVDDDRYAYFSNAILRFLNFLVIRFFSWSRRSGTSLLSHHKPDDHSDRGTTKSSRASDERF